MVRPLNDMPKDFRTVGSFLHQTKEAELAWREAASQIERALEREGPARAAAQRMVETLDRVINDNGYLGYTTPETLNFIEQVRAEARGETNE